MHVTLRVRRDLPHLRRSDCFASLREAFRRGHDKGSFRLVHYSVQSNHLHLLCEAQGATALARGLQGLAIRMARRLNRKLGRRGSVFADRYHARVLRTPLEVRRALVYVLNNARRHAGAGAHARDWIDPCSSAPTFTGWRWPVRHVWARHEGAPSVAPPHTWLLKDGWRMHGLLRFDEIPRGTA